jgi:hypothetical protein
MNQRFTLDGSEALESRLEGICLEAADGVRKRMPAPLVHAILLGGGYGRGEGGVLQTGEGDLPYNDLEFYILTRGLDLVNARRWGAAIHAWGEEMSRRAGIEVEFKLLSLGRLERSPVTMFYYDLVCAHRLICGDDAALARCGHHRAAHRIPLHEATRLLMNRCSGLLYSGERLQRGDFGPAEADFVGRNLAKAKLAFGDVLLALHGQYHFSCRERHKRVKKLEPDPAFECFSSLSALHEQGVDFKLHPHRDTRSRQELQAELDFLKEVAGELWLLLETRRLGRKFSSPAEYALDGSNKCPETRPFKNRLINLRQFGRDGLLSSRYPRERLLRALAVLLWAPEKRSDPETMRLLQQLLRTHGGDFASLVRAYESLWRIYN